jgi:hypothetical protein
LPCHPLGQILAAMLTAQALNELEEAIPVEAIRSNYFGYSRPDKLCPLGGMSANGYSFVDEQVLELVEA